MIKQHLLNCTKDIFIYLILPDTPQSQFTRSNRWYLIKMPLLKFLIKYTVSHKVRKVGSRCNILSH
jgi:hypothetical protein